MKDFGTYYGVAKGGAVVNSYGKPAPGGPSDWRVTSENRISDPVAGHSNASTNYDWMRKNLMETRDHEFVRVDFAIDPVDFSRLSDETLKAERKKAADKLKDEEREAVERRTGMNLSRIKIDNSVFDAPDGYKFYGIALYDFDEETFLSSSGEEKSSWRKGGVLKRPNRNSSGLRVFPSDARKLLDLAEEKEGRRVVKFLAKVESADPEELEENAEEGRLNSAKEKLDDGELEALGLSREEETVDDGTANECRYDEPWQGECGKPTVSGSDFCEEHHGRLCRVCKDQATRGCPHAGSLVCGAPLCDDHNHSHH